MRRGGRTGMAGRRRLVGGAAVTLVVSMVSLGGGPALAATTPTVPAPTTTVPAPTASTTVPPSTPADAAVVAAASQAAGVPLPPIPGISPTYTDGQDPGVLLNKALSLLNAGKQTASLATSLSTLQASMVADTVKANQAEAAADKATATAQKAGTEAVEESDQAKNLKSALTSATLSLYMDGRAAPMPNAASLKNANADADAVVAAMVGEQVALSPQGILAERRQAAARAAEEADEAATAQAQAVTFANQAETARDQVASQVTAMKNELATLGAKTAQSLQAESTTLTSEAGKDLTAGASPLEFTPTQAIPAPVATTTVALAWIFSELGKTYVYGATGPDTFDCSGLTQFVWNKAGVSIPRVAADQYAYTVPVPLSQLRPGDLVFFGTDVHHVGMYIGGGLMINAPHTGTVVQVSSIWWSDLLGFGRVHTAGTPVPAHSPVSGEAPTVNPGLGEVPSQATPPPGEAPITEPGAPTTTSPTTTPKSPGSSTTSTPPTTVPDGSSPSVTTSKPAG